MKAAIKVFVHKFNSNLTAFMRKQRTIREPVSFSGIGIHTCQEVSLKFCPADEGKGIFFKRVDLSEQPIIPASVKYVQDTARSTTLGVDKVRIHTVEHVLSAVKAFGIDNLCIEISNVEPPVANGSADVFVEMLEKAGSVEQEEEIPIIKIQEPIYWSEGDIHLVALPSDEYRISYTLSYPNNSFLRGQYFSLAVNSASFKKEIAPCRTFSLYEELSHLIDKGLIKGGSLDNAVVIKQDAIVSKNGLFFPDEMARHKILDLIGDLSLIGFDFRAHIIAIKSGHPSNYALAKLLFNYIVTENK